MILEFLFIGAISQLTTSSRTSQTTFVTKQATQPLAKCDFSVHKDGPNGEAVTGTALDVVLYYSIRCEPHDGYCLAVANCTISSDDAASKPYVIIDENGCSLESSLYDNVTYESKFIAGIRNPYPVRFRSSSAAVLLYCVTTLKPLEDDGTCGRPECAKDSSSSKRA